MVEIFKWHEQEVQMCALVQAFTTSPNFKYVFIFTFYSILKAIFLFYWIIKVNFCYKNTLKWSKLVVLVSFVFDNSYTLIKHVTILFYSTLKIDDK